jgi:sugar O-acyltransferase (sialic acid O-acetyltransferase NeuD family)
MAQKPLIGIFGAGGYAREVAGFASREHANLVFVDLSPVEKTVNGFPVISEEEFFSRSEPKWFNVAIARADIRRKIVSECINKGAIPLTLKADSVLDLGNNAIGEGAILSPFSGVTVNSTIGRFFHANIYSYVAHDCEIGDFVTFAPGVKCNGNVRIEDDVYIGAGVIIRNGSPGSPIVIGRGAVVGMGAVVTKSVPPGATVVGNPARPLSRN